jgi:hypothetical protein
MTIPVSTVPAVKALLAQGITDAATVDPGHQLLVCFDDPSRYQPDDIVMIGKVKNRNTVPWQMVGDGGAGWLREDYRLEVEVSVFRGGEDAIAPYNRAWELASIVEYVVRKDPSLGGLVIQANPADSQDESSWDETHKGRIVTVTITIAVCAAL